MKFCKTLFIVFVAVSLALAAASTYAEAARCKAVHREDDMGYGGFSGRRLIEARKDKLPKEPVPPEELARLLEILGMQEALKQPLQLHLPPASKPTQSRQAQSMVAEVHRRPARENP